MVALKGTVSNLSGDWLKRREKSGINASAKFFEMTAISDAGRLKTTSRNRGLIPPKGIVLVALPTLSGQHTPSVLTDGEYKKKPTLTGLVLTA